MDVISPATADSAQRAWWLDHGRNTVLPRIATDVANGRAELAIHEREIPVNRDIAALTQNHITKEEEQYRAFRETLNTARSQHAINVRAYEASAGRVKKLEA